MEESCRGRGNTLCWGFPTGTQLSQICLSPNACLPGQLVAFLGELMDTASSSFFSTLFFIFRAVPHANQSQPPAVLGPSLQEMVTLCGEPLVDACELLSLLIEAR